MEEVVPDLQEELEERERELEEQEEEEYKPTILDQTSDLVKSLFDKLNFMEKWGNSFGIHVKKELPIELTEPVIQIFLSPWLPKLLCIPLDFLGVSMKNKGFAPLLFQKGVRGRLRPKIRFTVFYSCMQDLILMYIYERRKKIILSSGTNGFIFFYIFLQFFLYFF